MHRPNRTMTDPDTIKRAKRTIELMNERLNALTDAERDRLIQQFMAEAMTTEERAKATMRLMNMSLAMQRRKLQREKENDG